MAQFGGTLPVYAGTRYQRGGGILSSIARFALPLAKRLFGRAASAVPGVVGSIMSKSATPKQAILKGLKTIGVDTAMDEFQNFTRRKPAMKRKRGRRASQKGGVRAKKRKVSSRPKKRASSRPNKRVKKSPRKRDSLT